MSRQSLGVVAIDDGGSSTVVITKYKQEIFPSVKSYDGERRLSNPKGKHDFIVEYKGERYVAGRMAKYDSEMPMQMFTDSKANLFFDLSVLIGIHQYGYINNKIVVSCPIASHTKEEKDSRYKSLIGSHTITVNGFTKTFYIEDIKVSPECASAYWIGEPEGKSHFLDLGSRTINYSTTINDDGECIFIDTESGTLGKGLETLDNYNPNMIASYICGQLLKKWKPNEKVYLLGGGANDEVLVERIKEFFPKSEVMPNPQYVNAKSLYVIGRNIYEMD